jgi:D-glycero-alpha-D-manno-heptose-7-phosphate kinase
MIVSRTPFRVSLFGGGTDYPQWYRRHGGAVVGGAIDKYAYISLRTRPPFFEAKHRIVYAAIELVNDAAEICHPVVRALLQEFKISQGLEIHYNGDLPSRSGLGSSSSFTVGLLNALYAHLGRMSNKRHLAEEAIHIEQNVIGENVGSQDQVWAAYGGLNRIDFSPEGGSFDVTPLILPLGRRQALESNLLLFFTGLSRIASNVAKEKIANMERSEDQLRAMRAMVDESIGILQDETRPIDEIGRLLHESWQIKRSLADSVSNPQIDELYELALRHGALGGKLLGAGGGGFLLLYVPPERQAGLREQLSPRIAVPFRFESSGSKIVVYEPNNFDPAYDRHAERLLPNA